MERRKKNIFICLYTVLWLVWAWMSRRTPFSAVLMAALYWLVLAEKKPGHYILYGWCGFFAVMYGVNFYNYRQFYAFWESQLDDGMVTQRPMITASWICFGLMAASIILTVLFRRQIKAAGEEKERAQAEKRRRRLDAKTAREQRGRERSE